MGKLNKLKIYAYEKDNFETLLGKYIVNINPESYTYNHAVKFSEKRTG